MAASFAFPPHYLWPIGFRFRPTEEELISHYLKNKMFGNESLVRYIREIDLYNYEPWELPEKSLFESDNYEWFFFRAHTSRTKRTTGTGCWRTTGDDRPIRARGTSKVIATRKILVFYHGRSSNAVKTNWVIHEYHLQLDTNVPYQRPFVICRLKENAEEKYVSTCDQDEQNNDVASHLKKKYTNRAIQEINREAQANGQSVLQPLWHSTRQPALADFQSDNAYDGHGEVNMQSTRLRASENEVNITEFVNSMFVPNEYFDDATSKMNQLLQPETSENELGLTELLNSVFVEDENYDEVTSNNCIGVDSYNKEELDSMVFELQYGGFSSDADADTAFGLPNNHTSPSWFNEYTRSAVHNMPTIKKSRRSPLTVKRFQYKEEKDIYRLDELRGNSSGLSSEDEARISGISVDSDNSDIEPRTFKAQRQPKSNNVVSNVSEPKRNRLKREIRSKAMSQDKAKEDEKHVDIVNSPRLLLTDSNNGLKSEAGNKATKSGMSCCGPIGSTRNCFSYIMTTKRIHHKASLPLVYVAKAFLGIIMLVMFAQEAQLYGQWR